MSTTKRFGPALLLVALMLAAPANGAAQDRPPARPLVIDTTPAGQIHRITLTDGSQLVGRVTRVDADSIQFESALGASTIAIASIVSVQTERRGEVRYGQYFYANPNATRLIFAPTGRMLARGEGYFSDYWLFFPGIAVGVADRLTIGGGMSIIPGVGFDNQVFYFTPKVGVVQDSNTNVAVGALIGTIPGESDGNTAGILYGVGTRGGPDAQVTAGLGYGFVNGRLADRPMLMLGGEARGSPNVGFVTENYLLPGGVMIFSGGVRFMGRNISVDLALASIAETGDSFCCVPFVGFIYKWDAKTAKTSFRQPLVHKSRE